ncbi:MAG: alpha/beta hydrolase fold family protein [Rhizobacter sp.]|nr:alpha/beta hydrolase fold family protein [Rhizobacter sp.]
MNGRIHPSLRKLAEMAATRPGLSEVSAEQARAGMAARTAQRPRGPEVEQVLDLLIPGPLGDIPVRIYRPRGAKGVALAFHGGGWLMGNLASFDATSRNLAVDAGIAVVNVDYRLAPEHLFPAAVDDAWAAALWVASEGASHGLDAHRLVLLGESAGGNLAAVTALRARDAGSPLVRAQVLVYPATDARQQAASLAEFAEGYMQTRRDVAHAFAHYGLGKTAQADDWRLSPLLAPDLSGLPPTLVITAECDAVRDDGEAFAARLAEAGVAATCTRYQGMLHTFYGMRGELDAAAVAQRQAASFLRSAIDAVM